MTPGKLSIAQAHQDIIAHSYRLVRPARAIALTLGLSTHEVDRVGLAALLHDIGKLALPTAILCKPGPLSEEEWAVMHRHPAIGQLMLSQARKDWAALGPIVAAHHERWDGGGYPKGLTKEAIPLEARILAVADAYDAMTWPRVYRQPFLHEEAMAELERCSGHQFDPQVAAAFLQIWYGQERCKHGHVRRGWKHCRDDRPMNLYVIRHLQGLARAGGSWYVSQASARTEHLVAVSREGSVDCMRETFIELSSQGGLP